MNKIIRRILLTAVCGYVPLSVGVANAGDDWIQSYNPDRGKIYAASFCETSGTEQKAYVSNVIANRTNSTFSVRCPIIRENPTDPYLRISVTLRDRHDTQDVRCQVVGAKPFGGQFSSPVESTNGTGDQVLVFGPINAPDNASYSVVCSIPPMIKINQPSYLTLYRVLEP